MYLYVYIERKIDVKMSSYFDSSNGIGEVTKSQQKGPEFQKRINLLVCYLSKLGKLYLSNIYTLCSK